MALISIFVPNMFFQFRDNIKSPSGQVIFTPRRKCFHFSLFDLLAAYHPAFRSNCLENQQIIRVSFVNGLNVGFFWFKDQDNGKIQNFLQTDFSKISI